MEADDSENAEGSTGNALVDLLLDKQTLPAHVHPKQVWSAAGLGCVFVNAAQDFAAGKSKHFCF